MEQTLVKTREWVGALGRGARTVYDNLWYHIHPYATQFTIWSIINDKEDITKFLQEGCGADETSIANYLAGELTFNEAIPKLSWLNHLKMGLPYNLVYDILKIRKDYPIEDVQKIRGNLGVKTN